jgi:hypothetical protein
MRKATASALLTTAAAAIAIGVTASPALADTTVTITNPNADGSYSASSSNTVLSDNGVNVTCSGSNASGTINSASGVTIPAAAGTADALSFSGCSGPLGTVNTSVTALPYTITLADWDSTNNRATGYIGNVNVRVSMPLCSFTVTGNAPGYYDNATNSLVMDPTIALPTGVSGLAVSAVSGCAGLVHNGDQPTYRSSYSVTPAITVTSP